MGQELKFNPFTGTFDWLATNVTSSSQVMSADGELLNPTEDPIHALVYSEDSNVVRTLSGSTVRTTGTSVVYVTALTEGRAVVRTASNSGIATAPAIGVIVRKPSSQTATVLYLGTLNGYSELTPNADLFLGAAGTLIERADLPITPGSVVQRVGKALSATTVLFTFDPPSILGV